MNDHQSDGIWKLGGGDVVAATESQINQGICGALLNLEVESSSVEARRKAGLSRDQEGELLALAWKIVATLLPSQVVGRRAGWNRFHWVLPGERSDLEKVGAVLLQRLHEEPALQGWHWHALFFEIAGLAAQRVFQCDPGYDLRAADGKSVLAWVRPYPQDDWQESQRYPNVEFIRF